MAEYNPSDIEPRWQRFWEENETFRAPRLPDGKKFYCLDMFPYPSGSGLHVGHPVGYTATDIISRYKRMRGFSVLHPMGFDSFGLPAEQHAIKTGEHPGIVTGQNCNRFLAQLKQLGLSYDWSREVRTSEPDYYKWTQWIFMQLYSSWFDRDQLKARSIDELKIPADVTAAGEDSVREYVDSRRLAYYSEADVNWCPALGTVLANEEIIDGRSEVGGHEVVRKPMKQWKLRITEYAERLLADLDDVDWPESIKEMQRNWIGKRHGAEISFAIDGRDDALDCFTTRPDTLFGCTFFVISPEHPLVDALTTDEQREAMIAYRESARTMSDMDRTIENRDKSGVFIGTHVVNPVNGRKVPLYIGDYVLMSYGTGAVMGVPGHDERDFVFARNYGLEYIPVVRPAKDDDRLQKILDGEFCYTDPGVMLPCADEVFAALKLEGIPNEDAKWAISEWLDSQGSGRRVVNYRFRDWLFSRQRYWGEPFPFVHWEDGSVSLIDESELPLVLPQVEEYRPSDDGESPLSRAGAWLEVTDSSGRRGRRETNTMPQWAGSCWYYLRFLDPQNTERFCDPEIEKAWMPVDLYVGGAEHAVLHLLYARFWHKLLFDLGHVSTEEPFAHLYNQGMLNAPAFRDQRGVLVPVDEVTENADGSAVRTSNGDVVERINAKMSKSLRNVVTPDDVIEEYGADTLRMYLMFMAPLDHQRFWDPKAISGIHRFLRRSWTLVTGNADTGCREFAEGDSAQVSRAIHKAVKGVTADYEALALNTAIAKLMEAINELSGQPISRETARRYVLLLAPLAPHLCEELWSRMGYEDTLAYHSWPEYDESVLTEDAATVIIQVLGKKRGQVQAARDADDASLQELVVQAQRGTNYEVEASDHFIVVRDKKDHTPKLVNVIVKR